MHEGGGPSDGGGVWGRGGEPVKKARQSGRSNWAGYAELKRRRQEEAEDAAMYEQAAATDDDAALPAYHPRTGGRARPRDLCLYVMALLLAPCPPPSYSFASRPLTGQCVRCLTGRAVLKPLLERGPWHGAQLKVWSGSISSQAATRQSGVDGEEVEVEVEVEAGTEAFAEADLPPPLGCLCAHPSADPPEGSVWIQCDECTRWCHASCVGMSAMEAEECEAFMCKRCEMQALLHSKICTLGELERRRAAGANEVDCALGSNGDDCGRGGSSSSSGCGTSSGCDDDSGSRGGSGCGVDGGVGSGSGCARPWTLLEDQVLSLLVLLHGTRQTEGELCAQLPGRSRAEVCARYQSHHSHVPGLGLGQREMPKAVPAPLHAVVLSNAAAENGDPGLRCTTIIGVRRLHFPSAVPPGVVRSAHAVCFPPWRRMGAPRFRWRIESSKLIVPPTGEMGEGLDPRAPGGPLECPPERTVIPGVGSAECNGNGNAVGTLRCGEALDAGRVDRLVASTLKHTELPSGRAQRDASVPPFKCIRDFVAPCEENHSPT